MRRIDYEHNKTVVHDPNFVDYAVYLSESDGNGLKKKTPINYHKCDMVDYERFSTP